MSARLVEGRRFVARYLAFTALCGACALGAPDAHAEVDNPDVPASSDPSEERSYAVGIDIHRSKRPDPVTYRSDQYLAVELRFGPYRPNVDDEFDGGATPYGDIFGDDTRYLIGIEIDWQALRIPHFGSLGPGFGYGYTKATAPAPLESDPSRNSAERTGLWVMPMYAAAVLRVDVLARDFGVPLVPYGKAGLSYALWHSGDDGGLDRDENGIAGRGAETGYQFAVGGMFLLNVLHPQSALDMDNSTGINAAYVFGEFFWSDIDSFGTGMQVGDDSWVVGLAFEY